MIDTDEFLSTKFTAVGFGIVKCNNCGDEGPAISALEHYKNNHVTHHDYIP